MSRTVKDVLLDSGRPPENVFVAMGRRKKPVEQPVGPRKSVVNPEDDLEQLAAKSDVVRDAGPREPGFPERLAVAILREPEVREIALSRELLTIGEAHPCWVTVNFAYGGRGGEIVRVQPPDGASDEQVERVRTSLLEAGAEVVRVMPRRRSSVLTEPAEKREHASAREVVARLVEESNVEDRAALREFVEGVMGRQGL
jgi:hypothetical protein